MHAPPRGPPAIFPPPTGAPPRPTGDCLRFVALQGRFIPGRLPHDSASRLVSSALHPPGRFKRDSAGQLLNGTSTRQIPSICPLASPGDARCALRDNSTTMRSLVLQQARLPIAGSACRGKPATALDRPPPHPPSPLFPPPARHRPGRPGPAGGRRGVDQRPAGGRWFHIGIEEELAPAQPRAPSKTKDPSRPEKDAHGPARGREEGQGAQRASGGQTGWFPAEIRKKSPVARSERQCGA